jgi:hypothetical protein
MKCGRFPAGPCVLLTGGPTTAGHSTANRIAQPDSDHILRESALSQSARGRGRATRRPLPSFQPFSKRGVDPCRPRVRRHELTDQERELLAPLIPRAATGRPRMEDRKVINGMVYKIRTGISWRDLPERYGPWKSAYTRFPPLRARRRLHLGSAADPGPCGHGRRHRPEKPLRVKLRGRAPLRGCGPSRNKEPFAHGGPRGVRDRPGE